MGVSKLPRILGGSARGGYGAGLAKQALGFWCDWHLRLRGSRGGDRLVHGELWDWSLGVDQIIRDSAVLVFHGVYSRRVLEGSLWQVWTRRGSLVPC